MTVPRQPARLATAFIRACTLDIATLKPGNVSQDAPGHRMTAGQFIASAAAAAPAVCEPGATVGRRILQAVQASQAAANCNTNLGIVLLCAPIAAAAEALGDASFDGVVKTEQALRQRLRHVLRSLTVADAGDAFRAIALANPAGLGSHEAHDVHAEATVDLRAAMRLAGDRDLVARQYVNDCADLFEIGLAAWREERNARGDIGEQAAQRAMQRVYLEFLARFPDSHIARKHGLAAAQAVAREAAHWRLCHLADAAGAQPDLARWDAQLKSAGLNPGTSADLAVATAFIAQILFSPFGHAHSKPG